MRALRPDDRSAVAADDAGVDVEAKIEREWRTRKMSNFIQLVAAPWFAG